MSNLEKVTRRDALARGLTRYFTGKPCKHGHVAERVTSSRACIPCANIRNRRYMKKRYWTNPEKSREYNRLYNATYRKKNSQKIKVNKIKERLRNASTYRKNNRVWIQNNRDKVREYARKYSYTSLGNLRSQCSHTAERLSLGSLRHSRLSLLTYDADDFICHLELTLPIGMTYEKAKCKGYHIDHIIPLTFISKHVSCRETAFKMSMDLKNLRFIPKENNLRKSNKIGSDEKTKHLLLYLCKTYGITSGEMI